MSSMYENSVYYNLFHSSISDTYWLASRSVTTFSNRCDFYVHFTSDSSNAVNCLFYSSYDNNFLKYSLRPLVSLVSNIQVEYKGTVDSEYNTWNLM